MINQKSLQVIQDLPFEHKVGRTLDHVARNINSRTKIFHFNTESEELETKCREILTREQEALISRCIVSCVVSFSTIHSFRICTVIFSVFGLSKR